MTLKITVRVQYSYVVPCIFWYVSLHFKTDNKQKSWYFFCIQFQEFQMIAPTPAGPTKIEEQTFVWFLLYIRDLLEPLHIWRRSFWPSQSKTSVVSKVWHRSYSGRNERQGSDGGVVGEWHADFFYWLARSQKKNNIKQHLIFQRFNGIIMEGKHVSNVPDFACPSSVSSRWPQPIP